MQHNLQSKDLSLAMCVCTHTHVGGNLQSKDLSLSMCVCTHSHIFIYDMIFGEVLIAVALTETYKKTRERTLHPGLYGYQCQTFLWDVDVTDRL